MGLGKILWADDEIDMLKSHIIFLEKKGYDVQTVNSGVEAIELVKKNSYDIVFLDENMPGISGLEALSTIKQVHMDLPVVMITKSEEEFIMEDAIGSMITDYLIKPVNPNQILHSIKKILNKKSLVNAKSMQDYRKEFMELGNLISDANTIDEWKEVQKKLVYWDLKLSKGEETGMSEIHNSHKKDANRAFGKYIDKNYRSLIHQSGADTPVMSNNLMRDKVFPLLNDEKPLYFILIDNLRYDQWITLKGLITQSFKLLEENSYCSILPTTTQYCRNAIFSGLMPLDIEKQHPELWSNDEDEGGKNNFEEELLALQLKRQGLDIKHSYTKITNLKKGKQLVENMANLKKHKLNVIVYNFVDALSHARTDSKIVRELAEDEKAYRSLTETWFLHSPLWEFMQNLAAGKNAKVIITTDHGSINVNNPVKIIGDKNTSTNLRYKTGKKLTYDANEVFICNNPHDLLLPKQHVSSTFVFAKDNDFFAYPNNFNHYVKYYKDTIQHGGISLEEMIIPFIVLDNK